MHMTGDMASLHESHVGNHKGNGSLYKCARTMTKIITNPICKTDSFGQTVQGQFEKNF